MNDIINMVLALIAGLIMGGVFFGGLWFTVRKAVTAKLPALWFLGSFIFRISIVLLGFFFILKDGNWVNGLLCLCGFIIARIIVTRWSKSYKKRGNEFQNMGLDHISIIHSSDSDQRKRKVKTFDNNINKNTTYEA